MFPNPVAREVMDYFSADASFHARHLLTSGGTAEDLAAKNWKYGIGGYAPDSKISYSLTDSIVVAADWVGFLCLFGASMVLMAKLFGFKGPDGDSDYFVGYREEKVLCIFVNLIAALTYWGRVCSHFNGDVGLAVNVNYYKYFDYLFTCPLLTLDLLWSLNLPYKVTYSGFVALIMVCGTFCNMMEPPARCKCPLHPFPFTPCSQPHSHLAPPYGSLLLLRNHSQLIRWARRAQTCGSSWLFASSFSRGTTSSGSFTLASSSL